MNEKISKLLETPQKKNSEITRNPTEKISISVGFLVAKKVTTSRV